MANSTQQKNSDSEERRKALFSLLTEEIKDVHEMHKLQGWTPWVLSATLISMAWLVVQDLWNQQAQIGSIHAIYLVVTLGLFFILSVRGAFNDQDIKGPFEFLHTSIPAFGLLTFSAWLITLAIACFRFDGAHYLLFITGGFFSFLALGQLFVVVAIAARLPVPFATRPTWGAWVMLALCLVFALDVVMVMKTTAFAEAHVSDIRAGGLLALGAYGLVLMSKSQTRSLGKQSLIELRRDLILGDLELQDAEHRVRMALRGLWLSDVVRDDMLALTNLVSEVRSLYADAFRKIDSLKASVTLSVLNKPLQQSQRDAVANTLDELEQTEKAIDEISLRYHERLRSVKLRVRMASRFVKSAAADEAKLMAEINQVRGPADEELRRFAREFSEIQLAWNRWYPDEIRNYEPFGISQSS